LFLFDARLMSIEFGRRLGFQRDKSKL